MPAPDRRQPAGLAGAARAGAPPVVDERSRRGAGAAVRGASQLNPHALALHQAIWQTLSNLHLPQPLVDRYVDLTRDSIFYLDPHICVRCRYRSTELLWQCPHCHEWNTFVEERIAPAKDTEATLTS